MAEQTTAPGRRVTLRCQFCLTLNRVDMNRAADRPKCGECGKPILLDRPLKVSDEDLPQLIRDAEMPVLVDFYADWCGPCKIMAPLLDDIAHARIGELLVAKLNTDQSPSSSQQYGIRGIPTLILFRDGEEAARRTGAIPREEIEALINEVA